MMEQKLIIKLHKSAHAVTLNKRLKNNQALRFPNSGLKKSSKSPIL